jgi:hypothetical protein
MASHNPNAGNRNKPAFENQGEGDKKSAAKYNSDTERFVKQGKVRRAAEVAAKAIDGREGAALRDAEEKGKARARGEDPEIVPGSKKHH